MLNLNNFGHCPALAQLPFPSIAIRIPEVGRSCGPWGSKIVGCGGDFDVVRSRRDLTCLITSCCLSLLLLPLLPRLWSGPGTTSLPFDCEKGFGNWKASWSAEQQEYCCTTTGRDCTTQPPQQHHGHSSCHFRPVPESCRSEKGGGGRHTECDRECGAR